MNTSNFKNLFLIVLTILLSVSNANSQIIQTIAGGNGEGALPQNFAIESPGALVIDKKGNIYFYEELYNQIKKIDAATGRIKTVVGNGEVGVGGDNYLALNAQIVRVGEMVLDSAGNLYFSGLTNNRIRKVNMVTGIITTIAGTGIQNHSPDSVLAFGNPIGFVRGLAFDKLGNLFFSEASHNYIRKIDKNTGLLITIAGTGASVGALGDGGLATAATFNYPTKIIIDDSSNIYVAELNRYRVRKISALTGIITTVAGNGQQGYSGDNGLATAAKIYGIGSMVFDANGNLILGDVGGNVIRKINKQTGIITTIAGSGIGGYSGDGGLAINAMIQNPYSMDKDSLGNILFCDSYNHRIRKINTAGIISTIVGNGTQGLSGLGAEAIFAQNMLVTSLVIDSAKNIYTTNNNRICKINAQTGILSSYAGTGVFGFFGDNGLASTAKFSNPTDLVMDKSGNLIFIDYGNFRIRKINAQTNIITTIAGTGTQGFSGDSGLAINAEIGKAVSLDIDSSGNIYFADLLGKDGVHTNRIRKINALTGIISTFAGSDTFGFSGDGGIIGNATFNVPSKVRVDLKQNVYIYDEYNKRIRKVDAQTGIVQTVFGGGVINTISDGSKALEINYYSGTLMEIDVYQNLFVSISGSSAVFKVDAKTGIMKKYAGTGLAGFSGDGFPPTQAQIATNISALKIDKTGNAWLADNNRIRAVSNTLPTILVQPKSTTACINNTTFFAIKASSDTAYQWQVFKNGSFVNLQNTSIFSSVNTDTLRVLLLDSSLNNDSFRCVVYGQLGSTFSNSVVLTIRQQTTPEISGPANVCQGQTIVYTVPNILNHNYLWSFKYGVLNGSNNKNSVYYVLNGSEKSDTVYLRYGIDGTTCSVIAKFPVKIFPKPSPAFTYTQAGGKLTFFPTQPDLVNYSWVINKVTSNDKNPILQFTNNGTYSVYLKVTDSLGCFKDTTMSIQVISVGVNESLSAMSVVNFYPNPVVENLTIEAYNNLQKYNLVLSDISGRVVFLLNNIRENKLILNLKEIPKGLYFGQIISNNKSEYFKVIKD